MKKILLFQINRCCLSACVLVFMTLCVGHAQSQVFAGKSVFPEVATSGYYHLLLPPEAVAASYVCLSDIRIRNERTGEDTPYLLRSEYDTLLNIVGKIISKSYTEFDIDDFVQHDSTDQKTYITFPHYTQSFIVNRLLFDISNPRLYLREGRIEQRQYYNNCHYGSLNFQLSSTMKGATGNYLYFRLDSTITIVINNRDNYPLKIKGIRAYGHNRILTAYLEKSEQYTLYCGNSTLSAPQYDLIHFKQQIPNRLPVIALLSWENIPSPETSVSPLPPAPQTRFIETPLFLLTVIIVVGGFLLWICWIAIKDIKKRSRGL